MRLGFMIRQRRPLAPHVHNVLGHLGGRDIKQYYYAMTVKQIPAPNYNA